jgi:hypothetical protein
MFLFENIFWILFYIIFANFKVLDIILEVIIHLFFVKKGDLRIEEQACYIYFYFLFHFFLGGEKYPVPDGTVVTGILDMRPGKHDLHFLVGVELLPHAFVNIPDEKMHFGVFTFFFINYLFYVHLYIYFKLYLYIFIYS